MTQWWERSLPANVARVQFPDPASNVCWVCCWFSSLRWGFFSGFSGFPPSTENDIPNSNSILALQVLSILFILLAWTRDEEKNLSPQWWSNPWSSAHRVGWMFQVNYMLIICRVCCLSVISFSGFVGEASRGWSWPCFDTDLSAFSFKCQLEQLYLLNESSEVCVKARSLPASLTFNAKARSLSRQL